MIIEKKTLNCNGRLLWVEDPIVMGIINLTSDSFYAGSRNQNLEETLGRVKQMVAEGAKIIDIGGVSSRPGANFISIQEEMDKVVPVIEVIANELPSTIISIDTYRSSVAKAAVDAGASIINDISAGKLDKEMYQTVASLNVPYILMHMQGDPTNMQENPIYTDITLEVLDFFIMEMGKLRELDVKDIILDPGFGFGKTVAHNYELLNGMHAFRFLECIVMAGLSRKSMIYKPLNITPEEALNGTSILHFKALSEGAKILRVHDVRPAIEAISLWQLTEANQPKSYEADS